MFIMKSASMRTKACYVRLLHLVYFLLFFSSVGTLYGQTVPYEGFGANAVGGSNSSTVYHVTNLNSSGAGSLANGIGSNRTIVFDVSGTIVGRFDLIGISYLTIDGSGQNIIINNNNNGDGISFDGANTHHCILKGIHVTNAGNDGINVLDGSHDILITNCSSYNNVDGEIDIAGGTNVTVQYCILGGSSNGGPGPMLITATNVSVHHNLFSPASANTPGERCPLVHCNYSPVGNPNADIRNNIVWKYGRNNGTGSGYGTAIAYNATGNVVNNYYYTTGTSPGSATNTDDGYGAGATGKMYAAGNVSGNNGVNANAASNHAEYSIPSQYAVTMQSACAAAALVLANAGPRPLNSTDQAMINAVTLPNCSSTPTNQPPTANAGNNITLTLPTNSTTLNGSGTDPDGTIVSYAWTRVSGPTTYTLGSPNSATTTLTNLVQGTYVFRLTVTDNGGATGTATVTITVNAAANQPPTANAGSNITLTLPTNSTTLVGSGTDGDGTIVSYAWTRVSGPTTYTLGNANSATTTLTNLVQGTYVFRLTVTDNGGATGTATVTVTVNAAANQPPTANAGSNVTLTLPTNSTTLLGSGSDPDGTIASYAWTRVSGPATYTLGSANSATTTLTNLVQGTYVFRLTVTDNGGATGTATVTVTVNAATPPSGNQPPVARTENDIVLTLPIISSLLHGNTSSDPDGVIISYEWTQLSGPNQAIITDRLTDIATISSFVAGIYTFQLKVTDDDGASSTKAMKVTIENHGGQYPELTIYPNPTAGTLNVKYTANTNGKLRLFIYDANRRLMKSELIDKNQLSITETMDVNLYAKGIYFIEIITPDNEKSVKQFVKM